MKTGMKYIRSFSNQAHPIIARIYLILFESEILFLFYLSAQLSSVARNCFVQKHGFSEICIREDKNASFTIVTALRRSNCSRRSILETRDESNSI